MKIVACIPVQGRRELLKHTIERLHEGGVDKVICSGIEDKKTAKQAGAYWARSENYPLGRKWNAAIKYAAKHKPDGLLIVGSSDFVSHNWLDRMTPYLKDYDMVGLAGCYFGQVYPDRVDFIYWGGYSKESGRYGEPIGIGRLFSWRIVEQLNYKLFDPDFDNSLDRSSMERCIYAGGRVKCAEEDVKSLSVGTYKWANKHNFEREAEYITSRELGEKERQLVSGEFPEIFKI